MKEIYINADDYNTDSIKTIQGNNNAEVYKLYLQYDNEKIDLTNKTVNLAFKKIGSTEGDIIENLNVTNAKEGEITLKITNKLTKKNGTYSCQLAILGEGDFLEHTATFSLTVENNIFNDITKAIADSKDFTYLENILNKASKLNEKLKENTSTATNANSNLESNITEANNINSKLLENTSTATSLNKNLEPINEKIDNISKQLEENKKMGVKLLANYTHTSNKLIVPISLDLDTGIYTTKEPHGLENESYLIPNFFVKDKYPTGQISDTPVEFWEFDYTTWYFPKVEKIDEYKFKLKNNKDNSYIKYDKQKNSKLKCGNWGFEVPSGTISLTDINFSKYKKIRIIINSNNYCKGYSSDVFKKIFNKEVPLPIDTSRKIPYVWQPYDSICPKELEEQKFKNECIDLTLEIEDDRVYQKSIRSIVGFKAWLHYNHPQNQNMPYTDTICFVSDKIEGIKFADNIQLLDLNYKYLNGATIRIYGEV